MNGDNPTMADANRLGRNNNWTTASASFSLPLLPPSPIDSRALLQTEP